MSHETINIIPELQPSQLATPHQESYLYAPKRYTKLRRFIATVSLVATSSAFGALANPDVATADDGGYTWTTATEIYPYLAYGYATCPSSDSGCKNYSTMNDTVGGVYYGEADPWGYELRTCTSYVAWREVTEGVDPSQITGLGNGGEWYDSATASERSLIPSAGDAAVNPNISSFGHVAYVESVNSVDSSNPANDNITVSEYNYATPGSYDTRTDTARNLGFTEYVNFGVDPSNQGSQIAPYRLGDYNGDHRADIAVRDGATDYIDINHTGGTAGMTTVYGRAGEQAFIGKFGYDGKTDIGVRVGNEWEIDTAQDGGTAEVKFSFGEPTDQFMIADYNGDGRDDIILKRGNQYFVNTTLTGGAADYSITFGKATDQPFVGDFNSDGKSDIGVRDSNEFEIDTAHNGGAAEINFAFGKPTDEFYVGDFNRNSHAEIVLRRSTTFFFNYNLTSGAANYSFAYGKPTDKVLIGDIDGNGTGDIILQRGKTFYADTAHNGGNAELVYAFGPSGAQVLAKN